MILFGIMNNFNLPLIQSQFFLLIFRKFITSCDKFSEDLDFDNFQLSEEEFNGISRIVKSELEKSGYEVEIRNVMKGAIIVISGSLNYFISRDYQVIRKKGY